MGSSYVFTLLATSVLYLLIGCGSSNKKSNDAPPAVEDQTAPSNETESEDSGGLENENSENESGGNSSDDNQPPADNGQTDTNPVVTPPPTTPPPVAPPAAVPSVFGQTVAPEQNSIQEKLLNHYCVACHRGSMPAAGLNLEDLTPYLTGDLGANGYRGVLLFPGRSEVSTLKLVIAGHESYSVMPPKDNRLKIPAVTGQQIEAVAKWIDGLKVGEGDGGIGRK